MDSYALVSAFFFSGHIPAGSDVQDGKTYEVFMWYMFVPCQTCADPTKAPILLFSNGGPGAPSSYGLFTELGPFMLSQASLKTSPPTLYENFYSWSKVANLLILNGPAPVGYSYCLPAGPSGGGLGGMACGSWNDTRTAEFNVRFLHNWCASAIFVSCLLPRLYPFSSSSSSSSFFLFPSYSLYSSLACFDDVA